MTKQDAIAIGEIAALDGVEFNVFVAKLNADGFTESERKQAVKGYRKFAK